MAIYSPLTPDTPDPEAPPQAVDKPEASQHWPLRTLSGILAIFGVATLCFWKLQLAAEAKVQKANVMASEMKMSNYYYPPCPTGTFHQCPETWDSGYHCLHSESFHHAKNYEKFNCRKVSEGPFPLKECLNQCRIGHFGKGRWAAHPYEDTNGKGPAQVGDLPLDSIYDGSDFVNGKAPPDAVYGSENGKGPAQVGDLPLNSIYDGSDFVNGKAPPVSFSGSDFVNGKAPPVSFSGSDFVNGKAPPVSFSGSDFVNGKAPPVSFSGSDFVNGKAPPVSFSGSDFENGKAPPVSFSGSDFVNDKAPPVSFSGSDFVNDKAPPVSFSGSDFVNGKAPAFFDK